MQPLLDANGQVRMEDHPEILSDDRLIRGITHHHLSPDGKGGRRISSMAYNAEAMPETGMSTDLEKLIVEAGASPKDYTRSRAEWLGAVILTAGDLRAELLKVGYDPLPTNPFHCQGWGKLTKQQRNRLARQARWLVEINGVTLFKE